MSLLRNAETGAVIATRVERAAGFFGRAVGLLARAQLRPDEGLWIDGCSAIHTVGMRVVIDVIFVDRMRRVVGIHKNVRPFRLAVACRAAASVVELGSGAVDVTDILIGDALELT